jgi:hypothetical protein
MLRYILVLSQNGLTLLRSVIASNIIALGKLVPLSLLIVVALSLSISVIASIRYHFSVIIYLLFICFSTSPISSIKKNQQMYFTTPSKAVGAKLNVIAIKLRYNIRYRRAL